MNGGHDVRHSLHRRHGCRLGGGHSSTLRMSANSIVDFKFISEQLFFAYYPIGIIPQLASLAMVFNNLYFHDTIDANGEKDVCNAKQSIFSCSFNGSAVHAFVGGFFRIFWRMVFKMGGDFYHVGIIPFTRGCPSGFGF